MLIFSISPQLLPVACNTRQQQSSERATQLDTDLPKDASGNREQPQCFSILTQRNRDSWEQAFWPCHRCCAKGRWTSAAPNGATISLEGNNEQRLCICKERSSVFHTWESGEGKGVMVFAVNPVLLARRQAATPVGVWLTGG